MQSPHREAKGGLPPRSSGPSPNNQWAPKTKDTSGAPGGFGWVKGKWEEEGKGKTVRDERAGWKGEGRNKEERRNASFGTESIFLHTPDPMSSSRSPFSPWGSAQKTIPPGSFHWLPQNNIPTKKEVRIYCMPPASSHSVPPTLWGGHYYCPNFANKKTKVQRGLVTCPRSHRWQMGQLGADSLTLEPSLWTTWYYHCLLLPQWVLSSDSDFSACGMDSGAQASPLHPHPRDTRDSVLLIFLLLQQPNTMAST